MAFPCFQRQKPPARSPSIKLIEEPANEFAIKTSPQDQEAVDRADIVKGYEVRKGEYVTIEPEEIAHLRIPSKKTLEIVQFINIDEIDPAFFEKPYFVVPQNDAQAQAFAVIQKALRETGKAGLGEVAFSGREHLIAIMPPTDPKLRGLMAYTMRYQAELRDASEYFSGIKEHSVDKDQLSLAKELIQRSTAKFVPTKFEDDYEVALRELIDAKIEHHPLPKEEKAPKRAKVINLMDALRKSVGEQSSSRSGTARRIETYRGGKEKQVEVRRPEAGQTSCPPKEDCVNIWRPLNQRKNRHALAVPLPLRNSSRAIAPCATST